MFILPGFQITAYRLGKFREQGFPPLRHERKVLHHRRMLINACVLVFRLMKCRECRFTIAHKSALLFNIVLEKATTVVGFHNAQGDTVFRQHPCKGGFCIFNRACRVKNIDNIVRDIRFIIDNGTQVIRARVRRIDITFPFDILCRRANGVFNKAAFIHKPGTWLRVLLVQGFKHLRIALAYRLQLLQVVSFFPKGFTLFAWVVFGRLALFDSLINDNNPPIGVAFRIIHALLPQ